jgi:hypothetical protein
MPQSLGGVHVTSVHINLEDVLSDGRPHRIKTGVMRTPLHTKHLRYRSGT